MSYAIQINLSMGTDNYEEFLAFVEREYQEIFEDLTDGQMSKKSIGMDAGRSILASYSVETDVKRYKVRITREESTEIFVNAPNPVKAEKLADEERERKGLSIDAETTYKYKAQLADEEDEEDEEYEEDE